MVIILIREKVTQEDPLSMVLYGITLVPLAMELCASVPDLLAPFYAYYAAFDGTADRIARMMKLIL